MSINKFKPCGNRSQISKTILLHLEWAIKAACSGILVQAGKWGNNDGMIVIRAEGREEADKM